MPQTSYHEIVEEGSQGLRLDVFLTECVEDASRAFIQRAIKSNLVTVNNRVCTRPSRTVALGDEIHIEVPPQPSTELTPEDIPLDILHEDADVLVVNKPSGLVVHPAPGHSGGTLVNAVLFHCPDFQRPGEDAARPGIVHRLDRDTSGVMVVAKSPRAFLSLGRQAREHAFERRYLALAQGEFPQDRGRINAAVGRSMTDRKRMSVTAARSRDAITNFEVLERFGAACLVTLRLETGRTHQIRVHLRFAGHPVLGDPVYGVVDFQSWTVSEATRTVLRNLQGQALHAELLGFAHPADGTVMRFVAPLPADFQAALDALRAETA
ncbi:MAG: RluA family pseudouridine synthase [Candidatus Hydrogenedentes bacterium]|nr:RluA family pseudouridine synthase [Candidatus Hydrogenedentota bacterium]NLT59668.1 RluA family pseudouridine synthase [Candidatus Hydrogenedentota bacterium]HOH33126.1 RluA family pseudouridine synthase [Candidatus Hydrogenedentota bacterium]HPV35602.1 RluA family pseudouridine synthase [Candidatus Hydrogenedentota bacterium]HQM31717.1 RluA family pseudouridine synthase [Candidatus Hydrogenedentota bacterium]